MTPLPLRSTHWPFSSRPMWTTLLPARFAVQTLPFRSTVVRDGSVGCPSGAVRYSPRIAPVVVSILTTVPFVETATQMNPNVCPLPWSWSWSGTSASTPVRVPL